MTPLLDEARRITGLSGDEEIEIVAHPGSRGDQGFVTFFLYCRGNPICLAKMARLDNDSVEAEAANLAGVARALAGSQLLGTIDRSLGTAVVGGRLVLFKEFLSGRPAAQALTRRNRSESQRVFRSMCDWALQFVEDTAAHRIHDSDAKMTAAEQLLDPGRDNSWIETFMGSDHHFLGPTHGDLVPANMLLDDRGVSAVVDFENFDPAGFPFADFVGLIVSSATTLLGRSKTDARSIFRGSPPWFSQEVRERVGEYCRLVDCDLDEFVKALPLYSDRAIEISTRWGMSRQLVFHTALRQSFLSEAPSILASLDETSTRVR